MTEFIYFTLVATSRYKWCKQIHHQSGGHINLILVEGPQYLAKQKPIHARRHYETNCIEEARLCMNLYISIYL